MVRTPGPFGISEILSIPKLKRSSAILYFGCRPENWWEFSLSRERNTAVVTFEIPCVCENETTKSVYCLVSAYAWPVDVHCRHTIIISCFHVLGRVLKALIVMDWVSNEAHLVQNTVYTHLLLRKYRMHALIHLFANFRITACAISFLIQCAAAWLYTRAMWNVWYISQSPPNKRVVLRDKEQKGAVT